MFHVTSAIIRFSLCNAERKKRLKEKEELQGMLPVDGRQLENVKGELLKLKKKEAADCQLWHNVARIEERKKQKNKEIADYQTWHNVASREEPKKQKNKEKRIRFGGNVTFTLATIYVKKINRRRAYEN
ncbi:hypothetical protein AVEN_157264-1 [Araneus ventricosus]|uniref:Uncharacterized protein n=1 Tax=Araneus ventricosus TaxID=182803 RepID=A0A4Y2HW53_ARAVE|nr:hypothetical protein AVEN_157264-1 [Araneus ventricosus]